MDLFVWFHVFSFCRPGELIALKSVCKSYTEECGRLLGTYSTVKYNVYETGGHLFFNWVGSYTVGSISHRGTTAYLHPRLDVEHFYMTQYEFYGLPTDKFEEQLVGPVEDVMFYRAWRAHMEGDTPVAIMIGSRELHHRDVFGDIAIPDHLFPIHRFTPRLSALHIGQPSDDVVIAPASTDEEPYYFLVNGRQWELLRKELKQVQDIARRLGVSFVQDIFRTAH